MCFVVEGKVTNSAPANPVNDDCTCSHQGNFEPFHIAQTGNEVILAQVDLDAQLCTQGQSLLMVLVMLGQL